MNLALGKKISIQREKIFNIGKVIDTENYAHDGLPPPIHGLVRDFMGSITNEY
jgi:hypothetical protein